MPSSNPDGRALNQRGNSTGQDLNRDHALIEQAETKAQAQLIRDYSPDVSIDNHEGDSEDLPILSARHLNVHEPLFEEGKSMVIDWMYGAAATSGWWMGPYSTGGDSHEGILRNTGSLKNGISMLGEARAAPGTTRPAEGGTQHAARTSSARPTATCGRTGRACGTSTPAWTGSWPSTRRPRPSRPPVATGRTVLRGSYPWPLRRSSARTRTTSRTWTRRSRHASWTRARAATTSRRPTTTRRARASARRRSSPARSLRASRSTASRSSRGAAACSCRSSSRWAAWSPRCWTRRACCRCSARRSATTATATA